MFDLRAIRENPEAFRKAWNRRKPGLGDKVDDIHRHDAALRTALTDKQEAEKLRNETSKLIGAAKKSGDEAEAARLMAIVADAKETIEACAEQEEAARKELSWTSCSTACRTCRWTMCRKARTKKAMSNSTAGARPRASTARKTMPTSAKPSA